jgi:hypothetical protein
VGKEHVKDLLKFLAAFPEEKREIVLALRDFVWKLYPKTNELIYDNYNALAFGWSPTLKVGHTFCSIAVGRSSHNVHFGFYWGSKISDPQKLLLGNGNQYRYLLVENLKTFPKTYMKSLISEAFEYSLSKVKNDKELEEGQTVTKSISPIKRPKAKSKLQKKTTNRKR